MSVQDNSKYSTIALTSRGKMARHPRKVKPGMGVVRVNFLVDTDLLHRVDEEAARMTADDPYKRTTSRTDALRTLLEDGLRARAERRPRK